MKAVHELVEELVAISAIPREDLAPLDLDEMAARVVAARQPLVEALVSALANGARMESRTLALLSELEATDRKWEVVLTRAQNAVADQLVNVRRMNASRRSLRSSALRSYVDVEG